MVDNVYKKISMEVGFSYFMKIINVSIGFLFFIVITRLLSNSDFGVYSLFIATSNILFNIFRFRLTDFLIKDVIALNKKEKIKKIKIVFQFIFIFDLFIFAAIYILQNPLLKILNLTGYSMILLLILGIVFMRIMINQITALYMTEKKIISKLLVAFFVTPFGLSIVMILGFLFKQLTINSLFSILFISLLTVLIGIYFIVLIKDKTFLLKPVKPNFIYIKKALVYTIPLIPLTVSQWIITASDRYFLAHYFGLETVSQYSYIYSLLSQMLLISAIIPTTLYPYLSEYWNKNNIKKFQLFMNIIIKYSYLLIIPLITGFLLMGKEIITMFSGPKYISAVVIIPYLFLFPVLQIAELGQLGWYVQGIRTHDTTNAFKMMRRSAVIDVNPTSNNYFYGAF